MANQTPEPQLAAPGAGLPWIELQVAKLMFRGQLKRSNREKAAQSIESEQRAILAIVRQCSSAQLKEVILIKRLSGTEDSSRNWSVWMTIEHLAIVNTVVAEIIRSLGMGIVPDRAASTAAVKPSRTADETILPKFERSCAAIRSEVDLLVELRTPQRYSHPWFGPLDAAAWHFMAGFHMRLHHCQIEAILRVA